VSVLSINSWVLAQWRVSAASYQFIMMNLTSCSLMKIWYSTNQLRYLFIYNYHLLLGVAQMWCDNLFLFKQVPNWKSTKVYSLIQPSTNKWPLILSIFRLSISNSIETTLGQANDLQQTQKVQHSIGKAFLC
jgi:hypothetical protein